jgi:hypothetical protein
VVGIRGEKVKLMYQQREKSCSLNSLHTSFAMCWQAIAKTFIVTIYRQPFYRQKEQSQLNDPALLLVSGVMSAGTAVFECTRPV